MSIPVTVTPIVVSGAFLTSDGGPASGSVSFTPSVPAATATAILPMTPLYVALDTAGYFTVVLAATDDPQWLAPGWTYQVTERITGARVRTYAIEVPAASPGGVLDLATVAPVVSPDLVTPYLLGSRLGAPDGVASLDSAGQVPLDQLGNVPGGGGGGGTPADTVESETAFGLAADAGVDTDYSRGDHTHGTPALPTPAELGAAPAAHTHFAVYEPFGAVAAHEADTTAVHGIADTAQLATLTDLAGRQPLDSDLTDLAGLTATTDNIIQSVGSAWASRTPAQVKTALALDNLDNTSDAGKPVSTAQQTALNLKANLASPTFTGTPGLPSGTAAVTQGAGSNSTQIATTAFVAAAKTAAFPTSGRWFRAPTFGPVGANLTMVLDRLYLVPFRLGIGFTADRIGCDVATVGGAGAFVRLGIWTGDASGSLPGTLLLDAGQVQADTGTGSRAITISQVMTARTYWLGVCMQAVTGVLLRATVNYDPLIPYFTGANAVTGSEAASSIYASGISGAFASNPTLVDNDRGPILSLRGA